MEEDTVQYAYDKENSNEKLFVIVNEIPYTLTKWFEICGLPVITYPENFPEYVNNSLHPNDKISILPSTKNHVMPMIMFNMKYLSGKNFSPLDVISILIHEVGHVLGENQDSPYEMEREYGADNFAAKIVGKDALIDAIDRELLYLNDSLKIPHRESRIERLLLKKNHLLSSNYLPKGRNERVILEVFPSIRDREIFISKIDEASRKPRTGSSK